MEIDYPGTGNSSQFTYDGLGRGVQIVENSGGTVTSTKQFVWSGDERCEARDASGTISAQYFAFGEAISGSSYYWTRDYLGSIREMTDSSASVQSQISYDPFGRPLTLQGSLSPDFQYASYYEHTASRLNLTRTRAYSSSLGRFISRDKIGERGGTNLFAYVLNDPINASDPSGTDLYVTYGQKAPNGKGGNFHHQVCVDLWKVKCCEKNKKPEGRYCISFKNTSGPYPFGPGQWYEDTENEKNPKDPSSITHTTCEQDKELLKILEGMNGLEGGDYNLADFRNSIYMPGFLYDILNSILPSLP